MSMTCSCYGYTFNYQRQMMTQNITENIFKPLSYQNPSSCRILIVDNEPSDRFILASILEEDGYCIDVIESGEKALDMIRTNPPDLVLMDIVIPGMDGFQVCRETRKEPELQDIPIIFITALNKPENLVEAFDAGGNDYLTKPFNNSEVRARVRSHLRLKKATDKLKQS